MFNQKGGVTLFLLIIILLVAAVLGFRYQQIATIDDSQTISQIKQQLDKELKSGGLKGMMSSLNEGNIGKFAAQALSLTIQEVVILKVNGSQVLYDFSENPETIYQVEFNVEQNNKILATDTRYMTFQNTLSDGLRFRGNATKEEFYKRYLGL